MTKKELLDRCAKNADDRLLLARVLDKAELAFDRGVPACTQRAPNSSPTATISERQRAR